MSRIYWHGLHRESELRGSERAYANILCEDMAAQVLRVGFGSEGHPLEHLLPSGVSLATASYGRDTDDRVRNYLRSTMRNNKLMFGGQEHATGDLALNTVVVTGSPALALLAKLHGYCESHAWVAEEDREWLAGVIDQGRTTNVLRVDMGWESVAEHLRSGDGGPVVTSYSVCDGFPSHPEGWMDSAWPEEQRGTYDWNALTEEQEAAVSARQDEWYELPSDEQWRRAYAAIEAKWWLRISPETLTTPTFSGPTTFWDAVASPEWRGEAAAVVRP